MGWRLTGSDHVIGGPIVKCNIFFRALMPQWVDRIWSCDLRANERPRKKLKAYEQTFWLPDWISPVGRFSLKIYKFHNKPSNGPAKVSNNSNYSLGISKNKDDDYGDNNDNNNDSNDTHMGKQGLVHKYWKWTEVLATFLSHWDKTFLNWQKMRLIALKSLNCPHFPIISAKNMPSR